MCNADEFLQYVAANEKQLKQNLRKNVTYDPEIFDDVFQTSIIKIYDSMVRQNLYVEDFEKYFFIGSKFEYINTDNKRKKMRNVTEDESTAIWEIDDYEDDRSDEVSKIYSETQDYLIYEYGERDANIFLSYYWNKINTGRTSYRAVAEEYNISIKEVSSIIRTIKNDFQTKNIKLNNLLYN